MVRVGAHRIVVLERPTDGSLGRELTALLLKTGRYQAELWEDVGRLFHTAAPDLFVPIAAQIDEAAASLSLQAPWPDSAAPVLPVVREEMLGELLASRDVRFKDFLVAPLRASEVMARVERALRGDRDLEDHWAVACGRAALIGEAPAFAELRRKIPMVAAFGSPVLLCGETGTGKERCARALHYCSSRAGKPFVPVNCGAIPVELFESELYGHQRGAFTGALATQAGLVAEANGGTLFLDEVETLSLASQVKLLRFLQDQTYYSLGSTKQKQGDVWIVASSNVDLLQKTREGSFRDDLYYRLAVVNLSVPPLRERRSDIRLLASHFLKLYSARHSQTARFSEAAIEELGRYDWPGNVRELENVVRQVLALTESSVIQPRDLPVRCSRAEVTPAAGRFQERKAAAISEFERQYVAELLREHNGNITQAGLASGKERRALGKLIKKYQLKPESSRATGAGRF